MFISGCPHCASSQFQKIEVEIRVFLSPEKNDFMEVRQEEVCCLACNWIPSDDLPEVTVRRKIVHVPERRRWAESCWN